VAFAGIGQDGLIAAAVAANASEASMQIAAFEKFAHHLADDGAPAAVLLLIPVIVGAFALLEMVFDPRKQGTSARVAGLVNGSRRVLHALHNRQELQMSEKNSSWKNQTLP
jgi:hypothetical protein